MRSAVSRRYIRLLATFVAIPLLLVLAVNGVVDPLWYFRGNVITKKNFAFNERLAKINLFLQEPNSWNCFIFGSSRTTLLSEKEVRGHKCFNFAFSAGMIGEFVAYATYLKEKGLSPNLMIVGVDGFNFFAKEVQESVPEFVLGNGRPPRFLVNYLSMDTLRFSYRTLKGESSLKRYYNKDFSAALFLTTAAFEPVAEAGKRKALEGNELIVQSNEVFVGNRQWYKRLIDVFPEAKTVFYVPPVSVWHVQEIDRIGKLEAYIEALYSVAELGVDFYDFAVPSKLTEDRSRTVDGSHYDTETNHLIVYRMFEGTEGFGIKVNDISLQEYKTRYYAALGDSGRAGMGE